MRRAKHKTAFEKNSASTCTRICSGLKSDKLDATDHSKRFLFLCPWWTSIDRIQGIHLLADKVQITTQYHLSYRLWGKWRCWPTTFDLWNTKLPSSTIKQESIGDDNNNDADEALILVLCVYSVYLKLHNTWSAPVIWWVTSHFWVSHPLTKHNESNTNVYFVNSFYFQITTIPSTLLVQGRWL